MIEQAKEWKIPIRLKTIGVNSDVPAPLVNSDVPAPLVNSDVPAG